MVGWSTTVVQQQLDGCSIPSLLHTCLLLFKSYAQGKQSRKRVVFPGAVCSDHCRHCSSHGYIASGWTQGLSSSSLQIAVKSANTTDHARLLSWGQWTWRYSASNTTNSLMISALTGFYCQFAVKNSKQSPCTTPLLNRQQIYFDCFQALFLLCCCLEYKSFLKRERKKGKDTGAVCASLQMLLM